jgi:hypothetical protein
MLRIVLIATLLCGVLSLRSAAAQTQSAAPQALPQRSQGGKTQSVYSQQQTAAPQQQAAVRPPTVPLETAEIAPGQSMTDVAAILRQHGKKFHGPMFSFARVGGPHAEETDHIGFTFDAEHTAAAIFYEVRTQKVTGIAINLKLSQSSPKGEQFFVSARKITLHPDGSYSIQFEKPVPPRPAAERPKSVYPTNPGNGQVPPNNVRGDARY